MHRIDDQRQTLGDDQLLEQAEENRRNPAATWGLRPRQAVQLPKQPPARGMGPLTIWGKNDA